MHTHDSGTSTSKQTARDYTFDAPAIQQLRDTFRVTGDARALRRAPGYAITADGRVFCRIPTTRHRQGQLRELAATPTPAGYLLVRLFVGGKQCSVYIHRLLGETFLPDPASPDCTVIRHLDGDAGNNDLSNLAWGTHSDNMKDMIRHGRTQRGEKNKAAVLSDNLVRAAGLLVAEGYGVCHIAEFLGVSHVTVSRAVRGESWGHVDDN